MVLILMIKNPLRFIFNLVGIIMFSMFKRKQQYVNVFISIIFNSEKHTILKDGTMTKVKWPVNYDELHEIAVELANKSNRQNIDNVVITSICVISDVYK